MKLSHLPVALLLLLVPSGAARAAPEEVKRVVRTFDFEERRLGNAEDLPMHWSKVEGPGMPHYVNGRLTTDLARSGRYSFRLDLDGGSVAYRYGGGRIPVMTGAHYRVQAQVRTTPLANARARLTAYLTDVDGRPLPKAVRHTDPYASPAGDNDWHPVGAELSADDPRAAFLVLEVGLLQPALYAAQTLGSRQLNAQDIRGSAWFDDITVSQVPRVTLWTANPANAFRRGEPVRLVVRVDDRFTDDLAAEVVVADADGRTVYQRSGTAELGRAETVGPGCKRLTIDLPELPAGLYRASLVTSSQGQPLGSQALSVVQLADADPPGKPDGRFGFVATALPFDGWDELPRVLPLLSAGRVKLALWGPAGDVQDLEPGRFDALLEKLQEIGVRPTACLLDLPPGLARRLGGGGGGVVGWSGIGVRRAANDPTARPPHHPTTSLPLLLRADPADWQPGLSVLVARHANHLDRWQVGADGSEAFAADPRTREAFGLLHGQFRKLVQRPDVAVPWPAWYEPDAAAMPGAAAPPGLALFVPPRLVLPAQVPLYLADAAGRRGAGGLAASPSVSLSLAWLDRDAYGREEQLRDVAQRVVYALSAGAERIDLPLPLTVRREQDVLVSEPTEELIVLRTLIATLGGATYRGKVPIADGVEAFLFDRGGQGVLAVWDRSTVDRSTGRAGVRELAVSLGANPAMIDLWGNVAPLQKLRDKEGRVSLSLGRMPAFLVGVDGPLMQTRASVALDRPLIESSFTGHRRKVRFTNAYRSPLSGTVRLKPPAGWGVSPATFTFSLNPGETFEREVTIELPYNSVAGAKAIDAQFVMQADGPANFTVAIGVTLGLSDVGMQTVAIRDGADVIVQQMITNYGEKPINYTAFASFTGQGRQERLITGLGAGKTTVKRYKFAGVEMRDGGKVRAGMKEMDGVRILNDEVNVR